MRMRDALLGILTWEAWRPRRRPPTPMPTTPIRPSTPGYGCILFAVLIVLAPLAIIVAITIGPYLVHWIGRVIWETVSLPWRLQW